MPLWREGAGRHVWCGSPGGVIDLGMDVSKNTIVVAVLGERDQSPQVERIANEEGEVRRLISRLGDPGRLRAVYEAGAAGYDLYWLLVSLGVECMVAAPSLIPKGGSDKVKTDLLTELPEEVPLVGGRMGFLVATVADHDHRRRCAAGSVAASGAAGRVA